MTDVKSLSVKELDDLRSMIWLADVGHPPTMAETMKRLLATIAELTKERDAIRAACHTAYMELGWPLAGINPTPVGER